MLKLARTTDTHRVKMNGANTFGYDRLRKSLNKK